MRRGQSTLNNFNDGLHRVLCFIHFQLDFQGTKRINVVRTVCIQNCFSNAIVIIILTFVRCACRPLSSHKMICTNVASAYSEKTKFLIFFAPSLNPANKQTLSY